ncbi:MAG: ATP-binding protein [Gammaproteobacteria bacterium]|jgi:signal transduction histidine kinase|nr:ATP-binding protein [Gammaproteobacteria bacterium]
MAAVSIRRQLLSRALTSTIAILLLVGLVVQHLVGNWLRAEFDEMMLTKAQVMVTLFEEDTFGMEFEFADEVMPEFARDQTPEYYQFRTPEGENFERSERLKGSDLPFLPDTTPVSQFLDIELPDGRAGRLLQLTFVPQLELELRTPAKRISQYVMVMGLARERASLDRRLLVLNLGILAVGAAVLVSVFFALNWVIGRGLRPLEEVKLGLLELDSNDQSQRLNVDVPLLDLEEIVAALNDLLARIEESFAREKRFSVGAAHELRTPIAELMSMSEVFQRWPNADEAPQFAADVLASARRMQFIVDSLAQLARGRLQPYEPALEGSQLVLASLVDAAFAQHAETARQRELTRAVRGRLDIQVWSSALDVSLILSNVIGNAIAHADAGSEIVVEFGAGLIAVSNKASGLQPEDLPRLFESLWRKDEARSSEFHVGLGLAIVNAYADRLGIQLSVELSQGWFTLRIHFPADDES